MPVCSTLDTFAFACKTEKKILKNILCNDIALNFNIFSKVDKFLEIPFDNMSTILELVPLSHPVETDKLCYAIAQWILHRREERLQHLDKIIDMIKLENTSCTFAKFMFRTMMCSNITSADVPTTIDPKGYEVIPESQRGKRLCVYVKNSHENIMKVFYIDNVGNGTLDGSDTILITDNIQWIRSIVLQDYHLYCLYSTHSLTETIITNQSFKLYNSPQLSSTSNLVLMPPPVKFDDVLLASIQSNIYVYNRTLSNERFVPTGPKSFTTVN